MKTVMKNLGKNIAIAVMVLVMAVLVAQQYGVIPSFVIEESMSSGRKEGYYIMTNASVDDQGNTIIKTMDTTGYFDVSTSQRSMFLKNGASGTHSS